MGSERQELAASLNHAKSMLGHSYMSCVVDMTQIASTFAGTPVDAFVIKAAAKAFRKTMAEEIGDELNVSRVFNHDERVTYLGVQDLRVG